MRLNRFASQRPIQPSEFIQLMDNRTRCNFSTRRPLATFESLVATRIQLHAALDLRVIFWADNRGSVIELDFPLVSVAGTSGHDQEGRKWEMSTMPSAS